ncbi:MAG: hypothetical protein ACT6RD_04555 [Brevundimonas sp.]|uniref:hypothetical protein n=1 Tax=Brevundimonas sp. TaxID=1871086 RepID=UPI0040337379
MGVEDERAAEDYDKAKSGTIYWTLSLYIEADKVAAAVGLKPGERVEPDRFRQVQRGHKPSLALANAVDPLMNDIADRETQGEVQEFLLAATAADYADMREARKAVRQYEDLTFIVPETIAWTTEGVEFQARPKGLGHPRTVKLRRFWLSHNNGALSYHLSFSHYYGDDQMPGGAGYEPATLYFLSLLQKLAAPKEYTLKEDMLTEANRRRPPYVDVFEEAELGIDPLDKIKIAHGIGCDEGERVQTFWPFVETVFGLDAKVLLDRLAPDPARASWAPRDVRAALLDNVPFIEVPGLAAPKSRFMFMLHDERFFKRLMPVDRDTNETVSRKLMVRPGCYAPYEARMGEMMDKAADSADAVVHLDEAYWTWVCGRPEYEDAVAAGVFARDNPDFKSDEDEGEDNPRFLPITLDKRQRLPADRLKDFVSAMRDGSCVQVIELNDPLAPKNGADRRQTPVKHHIPAFEASRTDCLEYLFLAGFNQNIIDFMNQDTSEILDSIDPIYPDSEDQSSDRFFVRYANHRAMITYVPKSRSLETGNDYIGACPYAFLIHVLALHNEFLARGHEQKTMTRIERIQALAADSPLPKTDSMYVLLDREPLRGSRFDKAETAINQARLATFDQYERFRHDNPFRYETERTVFKTLEELRGVSRKQDALTLAIDSLEDHAADLQRIHQQGIQEQSARRGELLNILLGMTGFFGAGQMFYWIGEKTAGKDAPEKEWPTALATPFGQLPASKAVGNFILAATEVAMILALAFFLFMLARILWTPALRLSAHLPDLLRTLHRRLPIWTRMFVRSLDVEPPRRRPRPRKASRQVGKS